MRANAAVALALHMQASMAVETAMRVDARARLAAYAGAMVELSMDASVVQLASMSSIATADFSFSAVAGMLLPAFGDLGVEFGLTADGEIKLISPIQWITEVDGTARRQQMIAGTVRAGDVIDGVVRRTTRT